MKRNFKSGKGLVGNLLLGQVILWILFATAVLSGQNTELPAQALDQLIEEAVRTAGASGPGVAVYIHRSGRVPYQKITGKANLEYGTPLTESSVFDLASVSKPFTGMAIAHLVRSGKLKLTADVRKYLPEVPDFGPTITLAHLLQHTSGLRDVGELYRMGNFAGTFTAETVLEMVARQKGLNFAPGTEHDYSNTGYVLLALVVQRVTGKSFPEWCQEYLFGPRGMVSSFANDLPGRIISERATAYYGHDGDYSFLQNNGMSLIGSSAVYASLADMAQWMKVFREEKELIQLMTTPGQLNDGTNVAYNFGLSTSGLLGRRMISHSGSTPAGFQTLVAYFPEDGLSLVVLSNWGDPDLARELVVPIVQLLLPGEQEVADETPAVPTAIVANEILERYAGEYLFNGERAVTINLRNGELFVAIADMGESPLEARSDKVFFLPPMNSTLTFEMEEETVSRVAIEEGDQEVGELRLVGKLVQFDAPEGFVGRYYSEELDLPVEIMKRGDELFFVSAAKGTIPLRQLSATTFTVTTGLFKTLILQPTDGSVIAGFTLDLGSRARNLRFERWEKYTKK